jgi:hypothetical protein
MILLYVFVFVFFFFLTKLFFKTFPNTKYNIISFIGSTVQNNWMILIASKQIFSEKTPFQDQQCFISFENLKYMIIDYYYIGIYIQYLYLSHVNTKILNLPMFFNHLHNNMIGI